MNQIMMLLFALGAVLGGIDNIMGNKRGYGAKFEEGFRLLGPTALSMAGMICITPALGNGLSKLMSPVCRLTGIDPAVAGGILAVDMGGFQLAETLANDPLIGAFAGVVIGAVFGCTITFTLPISMGILQKEDHEIFFQGIILGLIAMPAGLLAGGLVCGLPFFTVLHQLCPILLMTLFLALGLWKAPRSMLRFFQQFVQFLKVIITAGLMLGAVCHMLGLQYIWLTPLTEAMEIVVSICIVLLGSLPAVLFIQRLLQKPLRLLGQKAGLDDTAVTALFVGAVSVLPALTMIKDMDRRGKRAVCAWSVSMASLLGAQIAFTATAAPAMTGALAAGKLAGGFAALTLALLLP